jgi:hypothetical protein
MTDIQQQKDCFKDWIILSAYATQPLYTTCAIIHDWNFGHSWFAFFICQYLCRVLADGSLCVYTQFQFWADQIKTIHHLYKKRTYMCQLGVKRYTVVSVLCGLKCPVRLQYKMLNLQFDTVYFYLWTEVIIFLSPMKIEI